MSVNITSVLKKRVMPNIPYVFVFWFANKIGTAYRLAKGKDILGKIAGSTALLKESMSNILPSFHPFDLFVGLCGAVLRFRILQRQKR